MFVLIPTNKCNLHPSLRLLPFTTYGKVLKTIQANKIQNCEEGVTGMKSNVCSFFQNNPINQVFHNIHQDQAYFLEINTGSFEVNQFQPADEDTSFGIPEKLLQGNCSSQGFLLSRFQQQASALRSERAETYLFPELPTHIFSLCFLSSILLRHQRLYVSSHFEKHAGFSSSCETETLSLLALTMVLIHSHEKMTSGGSSASGGLFPLKPGLKN